MNINNQLVVYGSPTCLMVRPVRNLLDRTVVPYAYIDISRDPAGRQTVMEINDGYASVPTLVFGDGSTLTEPSLSQLKQKLKEQGYTIPRPGLFQALTAYPALMIPGLVLMIVGLVGTEWWMVFAGLLVIFAGTAYAFFTGGN